MKTIRGLLPTYIGSYRFTCRGAGEECEGLWSRDALSGRSGEEGGAITTTGSDNLSNVGAKDFTGPVPGPGVSTHEIA